MRTQSGQTIQAVYLLDGDKQTVECVIDCEYRAAHPIDDIVIEPSDLARVAQQITQHQTTTNLVGLKAVQCG